MDLRSQLVALRTELLERMENEGARIDGLFSEHDTRYGQRFDAQERALNAALVAAEKTVTAALAATKESNAAAQAAADRAVQKAEIANDQRFGTIVEKLDSVAAQVAPLSGTVEKLDAVVAQVALLSGTGKGLNAMWGYIVGGLAVISIIYNLFVAIQGHP